MKKLFLFFSFTFCILFFSFSSFAFEYTVKTSPSNIYVEVKQFVYEKTEYINDEYSVEIVENENEKTTKIIDNSNLNVVKEFTFKKRKLYPFEHIETRDLEYIKDFDGLKLKLVAKYDCYINGSFGEVLNVRDEKLKILIDNDYIDKLKFDCDLIFATYKTDYTNVGYLYSGRIELKSKDVISKSIKEKLLKIGFKDFDKLFKTNGTDMYLDLEHIGRFRLYN